MPRLLSRWFQRRDTPVVEEEEVEECSIRLFSFLTFSQEQYVQTEPEGRFILLAYASTQVLDWQSFSNDELHDELAFRLQIISSLCLHAMQFLLCDVSKERMSIQRWGATYSGDAKQWYFPPGTDLRALLRAHSEWLQHPELLRRDILLRIMSEVDRSPFLII